MATALGPCFFVCRSRLSKNHGIAVAILSNFHYIYALLGEIGRKEGKKASYQRNHKNCRQVSGKVVTNTHTHAHERDIEMHVHN